MSSASIRFLTLFLPLVLGCSSIKRPEVRAVHVSIDTIDFKGIGVIFNVDVHNPYPVRLQTAEFRYGMEIAGSDFMQSGQTTRIDLPASTVGTVPVPVRMEYAKLWAAYAKLRETDEIPYRLHGAIVVTALDRPWEVPLEHQGTLPMLRPPSFSSPRVKIAEVSGDGAKVALEVDVQNPNVCSIGLADLSYSLTLGEVQVGNVRASTLGDLAARSSGKLSLVGEIAAAGALLQLIRGDKLGDLGMNWSGTVQTPYGRVPLQPGGLRVQP